MFFRGIFLCTFLNGTILMDIIILFNIKRRKEIVEDYDYQTWGGIRRKEKGWGHEKDNKRRVGGMKRTSFEIL